MSEYLTYIIEKRNNNINVRMHAVYKLLHLFFSAFALERNPCQVMKKTRKLSVCAHPPPPAGKFPTLKFMLNELVLT